MITEGCSKPLGQGEPPLKSSGPGRGVHRGAGRRLGAGACGFVALGRVAGRGAAPQAAGSGGVAARRRLARPPTSAWPRRVRPRWRRERESDLPVRATSRTCSVRASSPCASRTTPTSMRPADRRSGAWPTRPPASPGCSPSARRAAPYRCSCRRSRLPRGSAIYAAVPHWPAPSWPGSNWREREQQSWSSIARGRTSWSAAKNHGPARLRQAKAVEPGRAAVRRLPFATLAGPSDITRVAVQQVQLFGQRHLRPALVARFRRMSHQPLCTLLDPAHRVHLPRQRLRRAQDGQLRRV